MQEFAAVYELLHKQCSYHSRHLGHLKALIDNDDWIRVVEGSYTGRVLLLGNSEVTNPLILFNTRMFDVGRDTITIHKLGRSVPSEQEIKAHHGSSVREIGFEYELEPYLHARSDLINAIRELRKNETTSKLRSLRDYTLAHYIEPDTEPARATLYDLLELTEAVNEVVDLAGYIVASSRGVYREFSMRAEKETRMLYSTLPELTNIEKEID